MLAAEICKAPNHLKSWGFGNLQTLTICSSVSWSQLHWKGTQTPHETIQNKMREPQLGISVRKEGHSKGQRKSLTFQRIFWLPMVTLEVLFLWSMCSFSLISVLLRVWNWISAAKLHQWICVSHWGGFLPALFYFLALHFKVFVPFPC